MCLWWLCVLSSYKQKWLAISCADLTIIVLLFLFFCFFLMFPLMLLVETVLIQYTHSDNALNLACFADEAEVEVWWWWWWWWGAVPSLLVKTWISSDLCARTYFWFLTRCFSAQVCVPVLFNIWVFLHWLLKSSDSPSKEHGCRKCLFYFFYTPAIDSLSGRKANLTDEHRHAVCDSSSLKTNVLCHVTNILTVASRLESCDAATRQWSAEYILEEISII